MIDATTTMTKRFGITMTCRLAKLASCVTRFKAGDIAGVSCMADPCQSCQSCNEGLERYCEVGFTGTYNDPDKKMPGAHTVGGYSNATVVDQNFVLRIPGNLNLAGVAPLLCAGMA